MEGISVLITAYKADKFILDCVKSLRFSTGNFDYEILIAVDGCNDTLEVVKDLAGIGVYYSNQNVGTYKLRNSLATKAKYNNLLFFDADDMARPELLQKCIEALKDNDIFRFTFYNYSRLGIYKLCTTHADGCFAVKKETFLKYNGFYGWRMASDSEFTPRLKSFGVKEYLDDKPLFYRRRHPNSLTQHRETGMASASRLKLKKIILEKIENNKFPLPEKLETVKLQCLQKQSKLTKNVNYKIGIGITTFNRNAQIVDTLKRIRQLTPDDVKLVVVDDGSKRPVPEADFRFSKNQGAPIAKNKCLELLEDCDHIFLFDDDTYPIAKGWEQAYINAGINHLNYSFKYSYEIVNGVRHLADPNGCMMYFHNEVLKTVGGFDTGFLKYGYWHGAYSNRVYNAGLIPHPFIDIVDSEKYIYCLDQSKKHRTSTPRRGQYLARNKRRYHEKLNSKEFIPYKEEKKCPKIWYSNPYNTQKNIGKALNEFCELVPDDDWICLQDGDMMYLTPDWGLQIEEVVKKYGNEYSLIGCMTNRLARQTQRYKDFIDDNHNILYHYEIAEKLKAEHWAEIKDVPNNNRDGLIAGMFMLFPKLVWKKIKFKENNIGFDDAFSIGVKRIGGKLGVMTGLYVYHFYRGWSNEPKRDRKHLLKK